MKKKLIFVGGALLSLCMSAITVGIVFAQKNGSIPLFTVEALARGESIPKDGYHLMAVGCGSTRLHDFVTYCCPGYEETCSAKGCSLEVYGCSR